LLSSKVYIDFGNHPGKDRFPREAAICGCCVITGLQGSAGNEVDVNIPKTYKFDQKFNSSVENVIQLIKDILSDYDSHCKEFTKYKENIRSEKRKFLKEIKSIFTVQ